MDEQVVAINLKGMDQRSSDPADADLIVNAVWDERGVWRTMPGSQQVGTEPTGEVLSMAWLLPGTPQQKLLIEEVVDADTSRLVVLQLPAGTVRVVQSGRRRGRVGSSIVPAGRYLYVLNEDNGPVKWDGETLTPLGFASAPAPPSAAGRGQGFSGVDTLNSKGASSAAGEYATDWQRGIGDLPAAGETKPYRRMYGVTALNEAGQESPLSGLAVAHGTSEPPGTPNTWEIAGRGCAVIDVPAQAEHVAGVRLYASLNLGESTEGNPPMHLLLEVPHGAGFRHYDTAFDSELQIELDQSRLGPFPQGASIAAVWGGRAWYAGMPESPNRVRFSDLGLFEQTPVTNYLEASCSQSGPIRAMVPTKFGLVVFCTDATFLVRDPLSPTVAVLSSVYGCPARHGAIEVPGLGVMFVSKRGPCITTGSLESDGSPTAVQLMRGLGKLWRDEVNHERLDVAIAVASPAYGEVWFQVPVAGDPRAVLGLVYHHTVGGWSTRRAHSIASAFARRGDEVWYGTRSSTLSGVYVVTEGRGAIVGSGASGSAISGTYRTGWARLGGAATVDQVLVHGLAFGSSPIALRHRIAHSWTTSDDDGRPQTALMEDLPAWGTALWSTTDGYPELTEERHTHSLDINRSDRIQLELSGPALHASGLELLVYADEGGMDR